MQCLEGVFQHYFVINFAKTENFPSDECNYKSAQSSPLNLEKNPGGRRHYCQMSPLTSITATTIGARYFIE